jgi:peroxiredoxin
MRIVALSTLLVLMLAAAISAKPAPAGKAPAPKPPAAAAALEYGAAAPDFSLTDLSGKKHSLKQYLKAGNVVVLEWFNPQCPFVVKYRADSSYLEDTAQSFKGKKVVWLAVNSSAPTKEGGDPKLVAQFVKENAMAEPVLLDPTGKVGHSYGAAATPHIFVISPKGKLVYRGAPDTSSALDRTPKGDNLVKAAVEAALAGKTPKVTESKPIGCSIKWAD